MIPVRLAVRDFLSYAEPEPLDLSGFDVACLSGPNGAGKSALLDATTWVLFGAARGCEGGQNQDRLIRDGADETSVELVFELNEATYQIVRRRHRSGKADVRFTVLGDDGWTNLAGDTMRQTDERIGSLLRMDYRTFVASAFFVQGRSDDFLQRMRPEERKEVFSRLLELGTYERLEAAARERSRAAERRRADRAAQAEQLAGAVEDPAAVEAELAKARDDSADAASALEHAREDAQGARARLTGLASLEALCSRERESLAEAEDRARAERTQIAAVSKELASLDAMLERSGEAEAAAEETRRLRAEDERAQSARSEAAVLGQEAAVLRERIAAEGAALTQGLREQQKASAELAAEIVDLEAAEAKLVELDEVIAAASVLDEEVERTTERLEAEQAAASRASEEQAGARARLDETEEKLGLLSGRAGRCPVCGEPLDAAHRRRLSTELRAKAKELGAEARRLEAAGSSARKEAARLKEELRRLAAAQRERQRAETARSAIVVKVGRLAAARTELAAIEHALAAEKVLLERGTFAPDERTALEALEARISATYDPTAHSLVRRRLEELGPLAKLAAGIAEARAGREGLQRELEGAERRAAEAEERAGAHRSEISRLAGQLELLTRARKELERVEAAEREAGERAAELAGAVAQLTQRLEGARRVAEQAAGVRREAAASASSRLCYERLATAFGRGGIPDRIIENALPDLREDANDILGRLSDYEMSLQFVMSRQTKSGKARETFDVLVHHEGGVRDFQMFSGGEAFRIAFAVRLALSKLLTRRAGARLETLVIDEGFGTQDPVGRERLIEAVNLARTQFAKVLVITHLEELKGMFDTQISVTKDDRQGSSVELVS